MKVCIKCEISQPLIDFYESPANKDGHQTVCKLCVKKYYRDNREKFTRQRAERRVKDPNLQRHEVVKKYGLTLAEYDALLTKQGQGCAVCGGSNANGNALSIDHDHRCCPGNKSCGFCIRGLLCSNCNTSEGTLASDPHRALSLASYMMRNTDIRDWLQTDYHAQFLI